MTFAYKPRFAIAKSDDESGLDEIGLDDLALYFFESGVDLFIIDLTLTYDYLDADALDFGETDRLFSTLFEGC